MSNTDVDGYPLELMSQFHDINQLESYHQFNFDPLESDETFKNKCRNYLLDPDLLIEEIKKELIHDDIEIRNSPPIPTDNNIKFTNIVNRLIPGPDQFRTEVERLQEEIRQLPYCPLSRNRDHCSSKARMNNNDLHEHRSRCSYCKEYINTKEKLTGVNELLFDHSRPKAIAGCCRQLYTYLIELYLTTAGCLTKVERKDILKSLTYDGFDYLSSLIEEIPDC